MADKDKEQEGSGKAFKVVDRRRFDLEGNTRKDAPPDQPRAPEPALPLPKAAAPAPGKDKGGPARDASKGAPLPPGPGTQAPPGYPAEGDDEGGTAGPGIDFIGFMQSLGQQALMQLGLVPYPDTGLVEQSLPLARQTIDILAMLQQKTRGNLQPKEERFMEALVYDLRMAYVKVTDAAMKQALPPELRKGGPGARR
ncbi:MAG: DUF1844 domain-containing protein [Deltaproteobacteria bacterium]|nr:DUF1844 domain-containing protein [Deltaproteobacteria bacterium]